MQIEPIQLDVSPYFLFVGSIRSPATKERYLQRMGYFFDYLNIHQKDAEGSFEILTTKDLVHSQKDKSATSLILNL